jgi:hypothetical protein
MRVVGVMLTDGMQGTVEAPGGYVVVGYDGFMVLRQETESTTPVSGDSLYLSAVQAGFITNVLPGSPSMILGRAAPVGPNTTGAGVLVPMAWEPEQPILPA